MRTSRADPTLYGQGEIVPQWRTQGGALVCFDIRYAHKTPGSIAQGDASAGDFSLNGNFSEGSFYCDGDAVFIV